MQKNDSLFVAAICAAVGGLFVVAFLATSRSFKGQALPSAPADTRVALFEEWTRQEEESDLIEVRAEDVIHATKEEVTEEFWDECPSGEGDELSDVALGVFNLSESFDAPNPTYSDEYPEGAANINRLEDGSVVLRNRGAFVGCAGGLVSFNWTSHTEGIPPGAPAINDSLTVAYIRKGDTVRGSAKADFVMPYHMKNAALYANFNPTGKGNNYNVSVTSSPFTGARVFASKTIVLNPRANNHIEVERDGTTVRIVINGKLIVTANGVPDGEFYPMIYNREPRTLLRGKAKDPFMIRFVSTYSPA